MFTLLWTVEKELELNLYIMQAQFDNKSSLSGYIAWDIRLMVLNGGWQLKRRLSEIPKSLAETSLYSETK